MTTTTCFFTQCCRAVRLVIFNQLQEQHVSMGRVMETAKRVLSYCSIGVTNNEVVEKSEHV